MKETLRLILTLSLICFVAGALLAGVNNLTKGPIAAAKREKKLEAIKKVLPPCSNSPDQNTCTVEHNGRKWTFLVARNDKGYVGCAVETSSPAGYGGDIGLMLGINADGKTEAIYILSQKETPGLGANITGKEFQSNFKQKPLSGDEWNWQVKKDGGSVDQITAATISSRAVTGAVKAAIDAYLANEDKIKQTGQ